MISNEHEAYTHLVIKNQEIEQSVKNIQTQMDFFLMNIKKDTFHNYKRDCDHALKELDYLAKASQSLATHAKLLENLAQETYNILETRIKEQEK